MRSWIDGSLYPDQEPPDSLEGTAEKIDFLVRLCGAWDFGVLPDEATVEEIRKESWREVVDACRLTTSAAYALLRRWHGLPALPYCGDTPAYIRDDPSVHYV